MTTSHHRRLRVATLLVVAFAVPLSSCGPAGDDEDGPLLAVDEGTIRYTALGDSFTSGAGIPDIDTSNACQRSDRNYPSLLARRLDAELSDVSCGSATNDDVFDPQAGLTQQPAPQLDGVTKKTDLVTVSLGLNDLRYFYDIIVTCPSLAATQPGDVSCTRAQDTWEGGPLRSRLPRIQERLTRTLEAVSDRAPDAVVVVVGYPQIVPAEGTCAELPVPEDDYPLLADAFEGLSDAMRAAAEDADAVFVDVDAASAGHDLCAGDAAWVNGPVARADAPSFHPVPEGHRQIADLVARALIQ